MATKKTTSKKKEVYGQESLLDGYTPVGTYESVEIVQRRFQAQKDAHEWAQKYIKYDPTQPLAPFNVRYRRIPKEHLLTSLNFFCKKKRVAVDIETTGFDTVKDQILSVQFSFQAHDAFLITWEELLADAEALQAFKDFLIDRNVLKVFHNAKFDLRFLCKKLFPDHPAKYERAIIHSVRDTYLLAYIVLGEPSKKDGSNLKLKTLCRLLLGMDMRDFDDLGGFDVDTDAGLIYAIRDADATIRLDDYLMAECPEGLELIMGIEHRAVIGTIELERNGVLVVPELIKEFRQRMIPIMNELLNKIHKTIPWAIDIDSPAVLSHYFFVQCKIPVPAGLKEKKPRMDGKPSLPSSDKNVLKIIQDKHPAITDLLEYKRLKTLMSSFTVKLLDMLTAYNELFASFMQIGTDTGRYTCRMPNLQQIPKWAIDMGDPDDKFIKAMRAINFRNIFRPRKGYRYLKADYKSQEVVMTAILSKCAVLCRLCREGHDLHSVYSIKAFHLKNLETGKPLDPFDKKDQKYVKLHYKAKRNTAKTIVFATLYGAGQARVFSLIMADEDWQAYFKCEGEHAKAVFIEEKNKEAKRLIKEFFDLFPGVREYHTKLKTNAERDHYICTSLGRRRKLDLSDEKGGWKRQAVNTPIQGSCGDILKHVIYKLTLALEPYDAKIVLSVHDELVVEARIDQVEAVKKVMDKVMSDNVVEFQPYDLEMGVDIDCQISWGISVEAANRYLKLMIKEENTAEIERYMLMYDYELPEAVL